MYATGVFIMLFDVQGISLGKKLEGAILVGLHHLVSI